MLMFAHQKAKTKPVAAGSMLFAISKMSRITEFRARNAILLWDMVWKLVKEFNKNFQTTCLLQQAVRANNR